MSFFDLGDEQGQADTMSIHLVDQNKFVIRAVDEDGGVHMPVIIGDQGRKMLAFLTWFYSDEDVPCPLEEAA